MKYAIFTSISNREDVPYAHSLGMSLRILEVYKFAKLIMIVSKDIVADAEIYKQLDPWDEVLRGESANRQYLNILVCNAYPYTTIIYVDPRTVFFNSPIHLFSIKTPATFFNSIYSAHMINLYTDILDVSSGDIRPDETIGHLHVYGKLTNNYRINPLIIQQALSGKFAGHIELSGSHVVDPESKVAAIDSRFMVITPDINVYNYAYYNQPADNPYLLGSRADRDIMTVYNAVYPDQAWYNLTHNYRVPRLLIRNSPQVIIYRKDIIEGVITANMMIYAVEASQTLSEKINTLSEFSRIELSKLTPSIERVTYASEAHKNACHAPK